MGRMVSHLPFRGKKAEMRNDPGNLELTYHFLGNVGIKKLTLEFKRIFVGLDRACIEG